MELLNQEFLEQTLQKYDKLKPIPFMARVTTELGEGFVVGYSDFSHIYKIEGCVLARNFKYPEYYVLLDKTILNPETQENQRAHFFKKEDVKFIKSFNDWLEERNNQLKDYFDNIKISRKAAQQKVMNIQTGMINRGEMDSSGLLQYKQNNVQETKELVTQSEADAGHSERTPSELMPSETVQPLANAEVVEAIVEADKLIKESIEIEVKQTPKPKLKKKNVKRDYNEPGLFS